MRNLTPATITEAQHQGAADLAQKLREWAADIQQRVGTDNHTAKGMVAAMELLLIKLDELAPTVVCDNPPTDTYRVCRDDATGLYGVVSSDGGLLYDSDMSEDEANSLALAHNAGCASYEEALLWLNWI